MKSLITGLSLLAAANFANAATQTTSVGVGETTAKIEDVKEADKKWSASIFQETFVTQNALRDGRATQAMGTDLAVGLGYQLDENVALQFKQWATLNQTRDDERSEFDVSTFQLGRTNAKAYKIGSRDVNSDMRLYVPMGEYWRELGRWEARYGVGVDQEITSDITLAYAASVRGYTYTKNNDGNNWMRYYLGTEASYKVNDNLSPYFGVTYEGRHYHLGDSYASLDVTQARDSAASNRRDSFLIDVGVNVSAGPVSVGAYVEQNHRLQRNNEFNLYESSETEYYLNLAASM